MNVPQRFFGTTATVFRPPSSGTVWQAPTATPGATDVTTKATFAANATGVLQLKPGQTNSGTPGSMPAANAAPTNQGWRAESYAHTNQSTLPTRWSGAWSFVYSLSGAATAAGTMTVIAYAITTGNVAREVFRHTSASISPGAIEANTTDTFTPADFDLVAGEILQHELWWNETAGVAITGVTVTFRSGTAGTALTIPSLSGSTVIAVPTQALTASVTPTATVRRTVGKPQTASITPTPTLVRRIAGFRTMAVPVTATPTLATQLAAKRTLTAGVTPTPSIQRRMSKPLSAGVTLTPFVQKNVAKRLSSSVTLSPTVATRLAALRLLQASVTPTPSLAKALVLARTLSASVTASPTALLQIPFGKVPLSTGGTTVVLSPVFVYEDG